MEQVVLAEIVKGNKDTKTKSSDILIANIDKYVIEIIRISEMYKFEVKLQAKKTNKQYKDKTIAKEQVTEIKNIEDFIGKDEEITATEEIKQDITQESNSEEKSVTYDFTVAKEESYEVENLGYSIKLNLNYQELADKTGFYQERALTGKVKVQIWPEHLPYDQLKRKRAFLMLS